MLYAYNVGGGDLVLSGMGHREGYPALSLILASFPLPLPLSTAKLGEEPDHSMWSPTLGSRTGPGLLCSSHSVMKG